MATNQPTDRVLAAQSVGADLGDGFYVLPGMGNALVAETDAGLVLVDAGSQFTTPGMIEHLRNATESPLHAICYSHGHMGYNSEVDMWLTHCEERGENPPRLVAHENILRRYSRYKETLTHQARMASIQFPGRKGVSYEMVLPSFRMTEPTETFADSMILTEGSRTIELLWVPSETDDAIALWFPDDGIVYGGACTPGDAIPNIGTPLRTQRFTIRWADSLDRLAALEAEVLVTEFGPIINGSKEVRHRLEKTAESLRWLRDEVVDRLNKGMSEREILADMTYPEELFNQPWMTPNYGCPEYIVRDLYREENGWWDRNPTNLHPSAPQDAAQAVLSAIAEPAQVLSRAKEIAEQGDVQLALHVIDLLALSDSDLPEVIEAKAFKAELCLLRAKEIDPYVSKACYRSSARHLDNGINSWQDAP